MRYSILHESAGRLRLKIRYSRMDIGTADVMEYALNSVSWVTKATVNERTGNAVVLFEADRRDEVLGSIGTLDPAAVNRDELPAGKGRELRREFEEKLCLLVTKRIAKKLFLPLSVRAVITAVNSVPYMVEAAKSISRRKIEVSILDAASILVSMLLGDFETASSVMFLLKVGDIMDDWTHTKSVNDLAEAMSLNVDKVWTRTNDGQEVLVSVGAVGKDDIMVVRTGSVIPLDGKVIEGECSVNQASMTGESVPVKKHAGDPVYSGTVVEEGGLVARVTNVAGTGRYDRIVSMIEESEKLKSETEVKASKLADRLVPYTFGATLLTYILTRNVRRAASILMVDFCCALKLSMPIAFLSAMREAGDRHISVKGGKFLEAVADADTIVFDKTGTLTHAQPTVKDIVPFTKQDPMELLRLAACLEEHYPHSIANAVVRKAEEEGLLHEERHSEVEYVVAHGIVSSVDGHRVLLGSYHFVFEDEGCRIPRGKNKLFGELPAEYSHLYMAIDGTLAAVILIEDPLRSEAHEVIEMLRDEGITKVVMMTGDSERTAASVARKVGVDDYYSEVLPEDKASFVKREHELGRKVIMVGDGINDSPALSEADVGIAISNGAAIAREIADITVAEDDLRGLVFLRRLSSALMERIHGNYRKIIGINSGLIILGAFGAMQSSTTSRWHNTSTILISSASMTDLLDE